MRLSLPAQHNVGRQVLGVTLIRHLRTKNLIETFHHIEHRFRNAFFEQYSLGLDGCVGDLLRRFDVFSGELTKEAAKASYRNVIFGNEASGIETASLYSRDSSAFTDVGHAYAVVTKPSKTARLVVTLAITSLPHFHHFDESLVTVWLTIQ